MRFVSYKRKWTLVLPIVFFGIVFLMGQTLAQTSVGDDFGTGYLDSGVLPDDDLRIVVINFVRVALGILGTLFLILVLYGGFLWMTARGDENQLAKGRKVIVNAVTGLIVIFMAFAITTFIFNILNEASKGPDGEGACFEGDISGCFVCVGGTYAGNYDPSIPGCSITGSSLVIRDIETAHGGDDSSKDVYLCSSTQALFNNGLDKSTVPGNVRLRKGSEDIPGEVITRRRTVEFDPKENLEPNTGYEMRYRNAIMDNSGTRLVGCNPDVGCFTSGNDVVWSFETGETVDTIGPTVRYTNPVSDPLSSRYPDRNVNRDKIINVTFNESIRAATVDDGNGRPIAENIILEELQDQSTSYPDPRIVDSSKLLVYPRSNGFDLIWDAPNLFEPFTWYRVTVQNIEDLCGNALSEPFTWEFQTNDRVPGVGGFYPRGTNVCPSVGVVTLTFNTSMYYDDVDITIRPNEPSAPPSHGAGALNASSLATAPPYRIDGVNGVWSVDPTSDFRVYTFTPTENFDINTKYYVTVNTDRIIDSEGNTLSSDWEFEVSDASVCACSPYISSISPERGLLGQCVTVLGQCFLGAVPNDSSDPRYATLESLTFNGVPATIGSVGSDYITTSINTEGVFGAGDSLFPNVTITYNDPAIGSISTENDYVSYFVDSDEESEGPCLLSINPPKGCYGDGTSLTGLRFGEDPEEGNRSTDDNNVTFASGASRVTDEGISYWNNTNIGASVPKGANDGNVTVTADGNLSNAIPFNIECGVGASCSRSQDSCVPDATLCSPGLVCNNCVCELPADRFTPLVTSFFPRCGRSCPNAEIGASFSLGMATSTLSDSTIDVRPCLEGVDCKWDELGDEIKYRSIDYDGSLWSVNITPLETLEYETIYRVILKSDIKANTGKNLGGLNFDYDGDGKFDSYSWIFATKSSVCDIESINVEPYLAESDYKGEELWYNAYVYGANTECGPQRINRWVYEYTWSSSDIEAAVVGGNSGDPCEKGSECSSGVCKKQDSEDETGTCTVARARTIAKVVGEGKRLNPNDKNDLSRTKTTNITAKVNDSDYEDYGVLNIDFLFCDEQTDCTKTIIDEDGEEVQLCPNSYCDDGSIVPNENPTNTCVPIIKSLSPPSGPKSQWTTIRGCYFGANPGTNGRVLFGENKAPYPQCAGGSWTNSEIVIEVPEESVVGKEYGVGVYTKRGLNTATSTFSVTDVCSGGSPIPPTGVPGICRLNPANGSANSIVNVEGKRFGDEQGDGNPPEDQVLYTSKSGLVPSAILSKGWSTELITTKAPKKVSSGPVRVEVDSCPSNSRDFNLSVGVGSPCGGGDGEAPANSCSPDDSRCNLGSGLFCERKGENACTCQIAPNPEVIVYKGSDDPTPIPFGENVCRNSLIEVKFNQLMKTSSLLGNVVLEKEAVGGECDPVPSGNTYFYGDVNGDWAVTVTDSVLIKQYAKDPESVPIEVARFISKGCGDVNDTGTTDLVDGDLIDVYVTGGELGDETANSRINKLPCFSESAGVSNSTDNGNLFARYLSNVKNSVKKTFVPVINAQQSERTWCPVPASVSWFDVDMNSDNELTILEDSTTVQLESATMDPNSRYRISVKKGASNRYGVGMAEEFNQEFITKGEICAINEVRTQVLRKESGSIIARESDLDTFFCAGRDDCESDVDSSIEDNQHKWISRAYDGSTPAFPLANVQYIREKSDPGRTFTLIDVPNKPTDVLIQAKPIDKQEATVLIGAFNPGDPSWGSATSTMSVETFICDNPWPSYESGFPYKDPKGRFELSYCRDQGSGKVCSNGITYEGQCRSDNDCSIGERCVVDRRDDLPALEVVKSPEGDTSASASGILQEFFMLPSGISTDNIAIREYNNSEILNPMEWYRNNVRNIGGPQPFEVDGYEAIREGRTVYVSTAYNKQNENSNENGEDGTNGSVYSTNMYLMSYNNNADSRTVNIYNQLLSNWKFTLNLSDLNICKQDSGPPVSCFSDDDCAGIGSGECLMDATKIRRDLKRIVDLGGIRKSLSRYQALNGYYPRLEAGSFIVGRTTSKWPKSWAMLGSLLGTGLPRDPINKFSSCPEGYDQVSCWNDTTKEFKCEDGSRIYQYVTKDNGESYALYANMEYDNASWEDIGSGTGNECESFSIGPQTQQDDEQ